MEQSDHHSGALRKQRLSRTGILHTLLLFLFLTGAGYAGISDETAGEKELTASRAEQIIWDISEVRKQAEQIRHAQFFSLQDSYNSYSISDQGRTKTISHYLGDTGAPEILLVLETEADRTVNSRHWIDGARQLYPFLRLNG